nr:hypothetical protein [Proteus sp. G2618]
MDKNGKIAVMVNNCFGDLPINLLRIKNVEPLLDHLCEYMWEESQVFNHYPRNKNGYFELDLYSAWRQRSDLDRNNIIYNLQADLVKSGHYSESNLPANKGFFVYHGIEGNTAGEDYPVGFTGKTKMGDYFRYLVPTIYASIYDFPEELRYGIAVSDTVDFTLDRILDNDKIDEYFPRIYCKN